MKARKKKKKKNVQTSLPGGVHVHKTSCDSGNKEALRWGMANLPGFEKALFFEGVPGIYLEIQTSPGHPTRTSDLQGSSGT